MYAALDFAFAISDFGPHFGPWVLRVNFCHLTKQFARALIARVGGSDGHFHNLIAALIGARVEHSLFAQAESLCIGGPLRNLQKGTAIDGRDFDFSSQRRLPDRDGNRDFNVVAFATEKLMRFYFGGDV